MAILYLEGFDAINSTTGTSSNASTEAYLETRYTSSAWSGSNQPLVMDGFINGQALVFGLDNDADLNILRFPLPAPTQTIIMGFNLFPSRYLGKFQAPFLDFEDTFTDVTNMAFTLIANNHLLIKKGSVHIETVVNAIQPNVWNYLEIKILFDQTVGTIAVRVNGNEVFSVTGIDTTNGAGPDSIDEIRFRGFESTSIAVDEHFRHDDLYILDDSGSANNDFLGPLVIETLFPDGAGADTDWTPSTGSNFQNVDEVTFDSDTTYNSASTAADLDLFTADDLAIIDGTVYGVVIDNLARVTEASAKTLICKVKSSTTEGTGDDVPIANTIVYDMVSHIFEQDPDAAAAWTPTTVNAMQIGYEVG